MSHSEGHVNFHFFRMGFYTETKCRALPPPEPDLPAAFEASRSLHAHGVGTLTRAPAPLPSSPPHAPLDPPSGPSPLSSRRTLPLPHGPSSRTLSTLLSLLASPQTLAVGSHSHCNRGNAWISAANTRQTSATLEDARVTAAAKHGAGAECAGPHPLPPPTLTPARPPPPPRFPALRGTVRRLGGSKAALLRTAFSRPPEAAPASGAAADVRAHGRRASPLTSLW